MKTLRSALVVVLAAFGLTVLATQPAQAAYSECTTNRLCLFNGDGGTNLIWAGYAQPGTCVNLPAEDNDLTNSFYNRLTGSGRAVQLYQDNYCHTPLLRRQSGASTGPHFSGTADNMFTSPIPPHVTDKNKVTSIWFNNCNVNCGTALVSDRDEGLDLETPIVNCPCRPKP